MNKTLTLLASLLVVTSVLLTGCALASEPQAAGQPIEAVPLVSPTPAPTATSAPQPAATEAPANAAPTASAAEPTATAAPVASAAIFEIIPAESEARFKIDETLQKAPKTVIGSTNQVAGQISIDPANLAATQVGEIRIDARTLTTDNSMRNRAVKNWILKTNDFEYVTFKPTEIVGLPDSAAIGEPVSFQIKGDLTVTDVTQPVVFDVTVTPESATRIKGEATTTILHKDFNLAIPDAPLVDEVKDEVILELSFVATTGA